MNRILGTCASCSAPRIGFAGVLDTMGDGVARSLPPEPREGTSIEDLAASVERSRARANDSAWPKFLLILGALYLVVGGK